MLDGLWIATAAPAVEAALAAMAARGPIAVVDAPRLARALTARGRAVTALGADDVAAGAPRFTTLIGVGAGARADWAALLAAWAAALTDGGGLILVDRGAAVELSRRALCAGLTALEQRVAGRWIVTSGLVSRL